MFMVMMAFASTCGSLVSNLIGAGNINCVPGTIRQHIRIAYAFVLPFAIFFALFPKLILSVYTDMPELQEAAVPSLWVLCSAYLFLVPANVLFSVCIGNRKHTYGISFGNDNTGGLYLLYHIHCSLSEIRCSICMDIRNRLFHRHFSTVLLLYEKRDVEPEKDLRDKLLITNYQ